MQSGNCATILRGNCDGKETKDQDGTTSLYQYNPERYAIAEDRAANHAVLRTRNGGPPGLLEVKEVVIGVTDFAMTSAYWHNLFVPELPLQSGLWQIGDGPAVRLVSYDQNALLRMIWRVSSLEKAKQFLSEQQMLGKVEKQQITIAPGNIFGLDIRLTA